MTELLRLMDHPLATRLGVALLHFVWQGLALGLLAVGLQLALRRARPEARYLVLLAVLAAMALCPVVTLLTVPRAQAPRPAAVTAPEGIARTAPSPAAVPPEPAPRAAAAPARASGDHVSLAPARRLSWTMRGRAWVVGHLHWVSLLWGLGVALLSLRFLLGSCALWQLRRRLPPAGRHWQEVAASLARRLKMGRPARVLLSTAGRVPLVIGWLRPAIVLPVGALTGLTPEQLSALLAHELAHLRRHDQWVNFAQTLIELLLFYHPAVWWVSRAIRAAREQCCDDMAVAVCGDAVGYLRALAWVEEQRAARPQPALAASGSPFLHRFRRLAGGSRPPKPHAASLATALALLAISAVFVAGAISAATAQLASSHLPGLREQWMPQTEHDPRLQQPVHIEIVGRAAVPALRLLSEQTGVSLAVAPEDLETVGDRKLTVIAQGCSLKALLVQIPRALQECHFDIDTTGQEPAYLLHRNGDVETAMVQLEEEEPRRRNEEGRPAREARLADARAALAMSAEALKELQQTDPLLAAAAKDPEARRLMELFTSLPDDKMQDFLQSGGLGMELSEAPPVLRQAARERVVSQYREAKRKKESLDFWQPIVDNLDQAGLTYADWDRGSSPGGYYLLIHVTAKAGGYYSYGQPVIPPRRPGEHADPRLRELLVRTGLGGKAADTLLADLAKEAEQERLKSRDEKRQREWREPRSPELHREVVLPFAGKVEPVEVQQFLAKETGLSFVSDYFTTWGPQAIPEEARAKSPVWRLLYLLGESWFWQYDWNEAGDCLVFHDRAWYRRVPEECPESLLTVYREKLAQQGRFTLDDVAAFATELERHRPAHPGLQGRLRRVPRDLEQAGLSGWPESEPLRLYALLTPEQKTKARRPQGLSYQEMTAKQRELVRSAVQPGRPRVNLAAPELPQGGVPEAEVLGTVYRITHSRQMLKPPRDLADPDPGGPSSTFDRTDLTLEFGSWRRRSTVLLMPPKAAPSAVDNAP